MIWLIKQIDSTIFGLTINSLCIFDTCWMSTAVVLVNYVAFSAHRKISFRTWLFQMFFNKSLINWEKFVSCLMQYSKKYWKWPETYVIIHHSYSTPQFQNFVIPPIWLLSQSITQKILLSLHCFLTPQFQTSFTNLLIEIFGVSNPTYYFFFWR